MLGSLISGFWDPSATIESAQSAIWEVVLTAFLLFAAIFVLFVGALALLTRVGFFREYFGFVGDLIRQLLSLLTFGLVAPKAGA